MMNKYIVVMILLLFAFTGIVTGKAEQITWGSRIYDSMEGDSLVSAQKGLILCQHITDADEFDYAVIDYATIIDERIVVCYTEKAESEWSSVIKDCIAVYSLDGDFTEGYKLVFDGQNGVWGVTLTDGELLYYRSPYQCIYKLTGDKIGYYHAPGTDTIYLHTYITFSPYQIKYDKYRLDVTDPLGNTKRVIDHSAYENAENSNAEKQRSQIRTVIRQYALVFIVVTLVCILAYFRNRRQRLYSKKENEGSD